MIAENNELSVIKQVMALESMKTSELESIWGKFFDHKPEIASRQHMMAKLAYRIQELAYGSLDSETEGKIKAFARKIQHPLDRKGKAKKFSPKIGTKITKNYHGKLHEVLVVKDGFAYNDEIFKSLSAIANKITGTKWNGLKFFGVK